MPLRRFAFSSPHEGDSRGASGPSAAEDSRERRLERERLIDAELEQSFPASDPPGWVQGVAPPQPPAEVREGTG